MTWRSDHPHVVVVVNDPEGGTESVHRATGEFSGKLSGSRQKMLEQLKNKTPQRWMAFLRAHFSCPFEVSTFFEVDEKTGRNWWNGVGRPTVDKALFAQTTHPEGYQNFMIPETKRRA